jgi:hypothetical protein
MGNTMIVLNSAKAVSDIFDKRGSNYSDRPDLPMIVDLYAITGSLILLPVPSYHIYVEWGGTGRSHSCAMAHVGRSTAASFTVTSIIAWQNIKGYNLRYQESFLLCC